MNFRTTIVLLLAAIVVGAAALWVSCRDDPDRPSPERRAGVERERLLSVAEGEVARLELTTSDGRRAVIDRHTGGWRLSAPVSASADRAAVEGLIGSLASLRSGGHVDLVGDADAATLGLTAASNVVVLAAREGGRSTRLTIGARTGTGGDVYVRVDDRPHADLVPALLLSDLDKPLAHFRESRLLPDLRSPDVRGVVIEDRESGAGAVELAKAGEDWRMIRPAEAPAESSAASDVVFALAGLRAAEFVSEDAEADAARFGLDEPQLTVTVSVGPPIALDGPGTQPAAVNVVRFGRYDDLLKKEVFVTVGQGGPVARVPAASLEALRKRPWELRDRRVVQVDPATVRRVTIAREPSPTERADDAAPPPVVVVERQAEREAAGAATQADSSAGQPAPARAWVLASDGNRPVDSAEVEALLALFNPLRVDRYLETLNFVQAPAAIVVTIEAADGSRREVRLLDPGDDNRAPGAGGTAMGVVDGTAFELPAFVVERVKAFPPPAP